MEPIDLEKIQSIPIYEVLREYCRINKTNIQDIDALDNYYNVLKELEDHLERLDFRGAGPLVYLGHLLLKIESERLLLKHMNEGDRARFLVEKGPLYRVEIDMAVQKIYLGLLSREKHTILIEPADTVDNDVFGITTEDFNRRRETDDDDLRVVIDDDRVFAEIKTEKIRGDHLKRESLSNSVAEDFDMPKIMEEFRHKIVEEEEIYLDQMGMDYLDAFAASLQLASLGEIELYQKDFNHSILVRSL